jgi:hypothetical protein
MSSSASTIQQFAARIRESRIASFSGRSPAATKPAPSPAASPFLVPIPAVSAWKSEVLVPLHFARDHVFASRLATAPSAWSSACVCVDLSVFVVHLVAKWNFACLISNDVFIRESRIPFICNPSHVDCLHQWRLPLVFAPTHIRESRIASPRH